MRIKVVNLRQIFWFRTWLCEIDYWILCNLQKNWMWEVTGWSAPEALFCKNSWNQRIHEKNVALDFHEVFFKRDFSWSGFAKLLIGLPYVLSKHTTWNCFHEMQKNNNFQVRGFDFTKMLSVLWKLRKFVYSPQCTVKKRENSLPCKFFFVKSILS